MIKIRLHQSVLTTHEFLWHRLSRDALFSLHFPEILRLRYVVFIGQPGGLRASVLVHKFLFPVESSSLFRVMERRCQWHSGVTTLWDGNKTAAPALGDCFISVKRQTICASVSIETCRDCVYRSCGNRRTLFHTPRHNRFSGIWQQATTRMYPT